MAIHSRAGRELLIIAKHGMHVPVGCEYRATLVSAICQDDQSTRYYFAQFLQADDGIAEIEKAIFTLPTLKLNRAEKIKAVEQAS